ncbi:ribosome maturation factor RimP [Deinobacterium chartae]|uniref:Ribosome maturation factor RimP n=1 Tax=Deinobacterium chartae TaxID=521158 RepID=A0A841I188_9DEIO|nr:ribosome maturation factor RimP [Deinobacterium chartae]
MNLQSIAAEVLEPLGYEVLEVQIQNPDRRPTVLVRIDRLDEQPVTIEDLSTASGALGLEFDLRDPIEGEYRLEVESPGPKRPLTRARHFERMLGLKVKVRAPGNAFTLPVTAVNGDTVVFEDPTQPDSRRELRLGEFQANLAEWPDRHR